MTGADRRRREPQDLLPAAVLEAEKLAVDLRTAALSDNERKVSAWALRVERAYRALYEHLAEWGTEDLAAEWLGVPAAHGITSPVCSFPELLDGEGRALEQQKKLAYVCAMRLAGWTLARVGELRDWTYPEIEETAPFLFRVTLGSTVREELRVPHAQRTMLKKLKAGTCAHGRSTSAAQAQTRKMLVRSIPELGPFIRSVEGRFQLVGLDPARIKFRNE